MATLGLRGSLVFKRLRSGFSNTLSQDKTVKVEEHSAPTLQATEILLKVICVGQNPSDHKHVDGISKPGDWLGCDFVGEVVGFGSAVPKDQVKEGEIRGGFIRGGVGKKGAFAEYITIEWDLSSVIPSNITPQQAAGVNIPLLTAAQAFYLPGRLGLPEPPVSEPSNEWILIWSGATSVGGYAIQLAKLSGFKVATTASAKRWDLLRSYGADLIVDYRDPEAIAKLKAGTGDSIKYGLDCISEGDSFIKSQLAFRPEGGTLITLLFRLKDLPRPEVKTIPTMLYTCLGENFKLPMGTFEFKTEPSHRELLVRWDKKITQLLAEDKIKPIPVQVLGGLGDIQKGLDLMRAQKHKNKLVYNVPL